MSNPPSNDSSFSSTLGAGLGASFGLAASFLSSFLASTGLPLEAPPPNDAPPTLVNPALTTWIS